MNSLKRLRSASTLRSGTPSALANLLLRAFRLDVHVHFELGAVVLLGVEDDGAGVAGAAFALPCQHLVRHLPGDARVPLLAFAADFGCPVQAFVAHLLD